MPKKIQCFLNFLNVTVEYTHRCSLLQVPVYFFTLNVRAEKAEIEMFLVMWFNTLRWKAVLGTTCSDCGMS